MSGGRRRGTVDSSLLMVDGWGAKAEETARRDGRALPVDCGEIRERVSDFGSRIRCSPAGLISLISGLPCPAPFRPNTLPWPHQTGCRRRHTPRLLVDVPRTDP